MPWSAKSIEDRRFDALRLLKQVPAITELAQIDFTGKERLRVSRIAINVVESGLDLEDPKFTEAVANKVYYGPVYFHRESEPYMTLSLAGNRKDAGVTIAEVNLKLIRDVVGALGPTAQASAEPRPAGEHAVGVTPDSAPLQQRVHVGGAGQQFGLGLVVDGVADGDHRLDVGAGCSLAARDAAGDEPRPVSRSGDQPDGGGNAVPEHLRPRSGQRSRRGVRTEFGSDGTQCPIDSGAQKCLVTGSIDVTDGRGDPTTGWNDGRHADDCHPPSIWSHSRDTYETRKTRTEANFCRMTVISRQSRSAP